MFSLGFIIGLVQCSWPCKREQRSLLFEDNEIPKGGRVRSKGGKSRIRQREEEGGKEDEWREEHLKL